MNKAIVCVDDEAIILDSLGEQIERIFGDEFIYESAENAEEGMQIIEELDHEDIQVLVIVSDWLMPGMKGDEFLIEVHKKYPEIVKVMLTGQADDKAINHAREKGGLHASIAKPWSSHELESVIRSGLQMMKS